TEVWIHSRATAKTMNFGKELVLGITQVDGLKSRGVKKGYPTNANADFWCNRLTKSMSALVEVCFVNNDADARNFMKKYKEYGAAISNVCVNFL
ncbi:MAG: hypothetical protein RR048_04315, partial [Oscillospiraceae bacterium]